MKVRNLRGFFSIKTKLLIALKAALEATESSAYLLFRKEIEIKDISRPPR